MYLLLSFFNKLYLISNTACFCHFIWWRDRSYSSSHQNECPRTCQSQGKARKKWQAVSQLKDSYYAEGERHRVAQQNLAGLIPTKSKWWIFLNLLKRNGARSSFQCSTTSSLHLISHLMLSLRPVMNLLHYCRPLSRKFFLKLNMGWLQWIVFISL